MPYSLDLRSGLPDYARLDLAQQVRGVKLQPTIGAGVVIPFQDGMIYVPVTVHAHYTTGAGGALSAFTVTYVDADGDTIAIVPSVVAQPAAKGFDYSFVADVSVAYTQPSTFAKQVMPLPAMILYPGYQIQARAIGGDPAQDTWNQLDWVLLEIPTGPTEPVETQAPPTPILVG